MHGGAGGDGGWWMVVCWCIVALVQGCRRMVGLVHGSAADGVSAQMQLRVSNLSQYSTSSRCTSC